jgi:hypothetical protein
MRVQAKEHQFCRKCGKRFVFRDTAIKRIDADKLLEWAGNNYDLCPDCYKIEATQTAIKRAEGYGLPRISGGTQKQTAFAIMLRDRYITTNFCLFQHIQKGISDFGISSVQNSIKGNSALETMCSVFTESCSEAIIAALQ